MDPISIEELALLDVLERIDQHMELGANASDLRLRVVEVGLAEMVDEDLRLTEAGIERCKSLHHRVAADDEAARVLAEREKSSAASTSDS